MLDVVGGKEKVVVVVAVVGTVDAASCLVAEAEHRRVCKKSKMKLLQLFTDGRLEQFLKEMLLLLVIYFKLVLSNSSHAGAPS